jgi:hypothetical protein
VKLRRGASTEIPQLAYLAWAVETHPETARVAGGQRPPESHVLVELIEESVRRDLRRGQTWRNNPRLILRSPRLFLGRDEDPLLPFAEQARSYNQLMSAFWAGFMADARAAEWLVAIAVRGNLNRRIAVAGFLSLIGLQFPDRPDPSAEADHQALASGTLLAEWAEFVIAERPTPGQRILEDLTALYVNQFDWGEVEADPSSGQLRSVLELYARTYNRLSERDGTIVLDELGIDDRDVRRELRERIRGLPHPTRATEADALAVFRRISAGDLEYFFPIRIDRRSLGEVIRSWLDRHG